MTTAPQAASPASSSPPSFQLRGGAFTLLVLKLSDPKDPLLFKTLADKVGQAPNFFRFAPLVIDLQSMAEAEPFNIAELGRRLRQHQLVPIGIQNGNEEQIKAAINAGFSILPEGRDAPLQQPAPSQPPAPRRKAAAKTESAAEQQLPSPAATVTSATGSATRVIVQPVRSGRQIYAHGGDLVVLASTSPGAELLADGHIHIYGALRGRAVAGVSGDTNARIFCRSLEADLVSIAGYYQVRENIAEELIGKAVQIFLDSERIVIEPLA